MTQGLVAGPSQRTGRNLARIALVVIAFIITLALIIPYGSGDFVFAQAQPTGNKIEIINPHQDLTGDDPPELSIKEDMDTRYHLNSWVRDVPPGPHVEFKLIGPSPSTAEVTLGAGNRNGDNNFELFTNLCGEGSDPGQTPPPANCPVAEGNYTLRATLFRNFSGPGTGSVESSDDMAVEVNNSPTTPSIPSDPAAQAETVEIVYPTNSGGLGFYFDHNGATNFVIDGVASSGTRAVRGFYAVVPVGSDLNGSWKPCGGFVGSQTIDEPASAPAPSHFFRVKCTLASDESGSQVTAVAMVANDTPSPAPSGQAQFDDSTDAHRVIPYLQQINQVTFVEGSERAEPAGDCTSPPFKSRVVDQNNRLISGVPMDVHAKGPNDELKFDTDSGSGEDDNSANQPPDSAGAGHDEEDAFDCSSDDTGGNQGDHEVTGGQPAGADIKHIESAPAGTDKNGLFKFSLRSGQAGVTKVTVWADADDDDRFCSGERSGFARVNWGGGGNDQFPQPGPDFAGSCPQPSPPPGGTTATTTTATTGTTTTGTTTTTTSGTATTTTTTGQTTTTTPPPGQERVGSNVTIKRNKPRFLGKVGSQRKRCQRVRQVVVKKRLKRGRSKTVGQDMTNRRGKWKVRKPRARGRFFAVARRKVFTARDGTRVVCRPDRSRAIRVRRGR